MESYQHINYGLKITLIHFDLKFEDRLTNSKTSFVSQDVRPNGSFVVLSSPNMKYRYQCSLDQQRSQKYLPILNSSPKMGEKSWKKVSNCSTHEIMRDTTRVGESVKTKTVFPDVFTLFHTFASMDNFSD